MTARERLALVLQTDPTLAHDAMGDESPGFEAIDVDPNAVSDLEFRLKVSNRLLAAEKQIEEQRRILGRITTRFAIDGRPLPTEDSDAA
jgi:hypothetical protein